MPETWRLASSLTPRQLEVLRLRALGWTVDRIREHCGIAKATYYHHLENAKERLDVASEPEAWAALGWLQVPE